MAAPTIRRARASRPLSPSAAHDAGPARVSSLSGARTTDPSDVAMFFAAPGAGGSLPPTPDATPPPSLPPGSPDKAKRSSKSKDKAQGTRRRPWDDLDDDARDDEDILAKYAPLDPDDAPQSPILPRVKLSFPTIFSDDEDDDLKAPWASVPPRHKTWSQTTTTTTTRRTERRVWRNSLPSQGHATGSGQWQALDEPPSAGAAHSSRAVSSASSSSPRSSIPFPRSSKPAASSRRAPPLPAGPTASPSRRSTRRSFPGAFSAPSSRPARPSLFSSSAYSLASPTAPTPAPSSYLQPLLNVLLVLAVSAVAFCSVSAVLVAGFTLTLYDDGRKHVGHLRGAIGEGQKRVKGSLEGVRDGAARVLGGAVETFAGAKRLAMSSSVENSPDPDSDSTLPASSPTRRRSPTPRPSHRGRSRTPRRPVPPPSPASTDAGWTSDENILPYDVPRPSPSSSRPASPAPSASSNSSSPKLPPRPPLRILLPSIVLALLWTLWQITSSLWTKKPQTRPKNDDRPRPKRTATAS